MDFYAREAALIAASYAIGCLSTGYYLVRWRTHADVRGMGSGSIGARNVGRALGRKAFAATLVGDAAKGAIPVAVALFTGMEQWVVMAVMFAVVAGHLWPAQLGLRGGKGLATAMGALLVLDFRLALAAFTITGIAWIVSRNATTSALCAVAITPFIALATRHNLLVFASLAVMSVLIVFAHRTNLRAIAADMKQSAGDRT